MTKEMHACRCGMATRLVGDGCEHCNPEMTIDILREQIADMRLTDAEREAADAGADALESLASNAANGRVRGALMIAANTLRGLLERTK